VTPRPLARAIILAAGCGRRLGALGEDTAKCLLSFGGQTLIERHVSALHEIGVREIAVVVGHQHAAVQSALAELTHRPRPQTVFNPSFAQGSIVSLWHARHLLAKGGDVLLMDADVLGPSALLAHLAACAGDLFLLDRAFDDREAEAVKLCVRGARLVEFRKQIDPDLEFDSAGESVGFFRLTESTARELAARCEAYVRAERTEEPYEEAIRDLLLAAPDRFGFCDVTGIPWIEIDFPEDVEKARTAILPKISQYAAGGGRAASGLPA
jgi:choline kinase